MRIKFLKKLSHIIYKYPGQIIAIAFILVGISAFLTISKLKISADYFEMISNSKKYKNDYVNFTKEFGDTEMIYIVIESKGNVKKAKKFADTINKKLSKQKEHIKKIFYKVDYEKFGRNILLFLDVKNLRLLRRALIKNKDGLKLMASLKNINGLLNEINKRLKTNLSKNLKGKVTKQGVEELKQWMEFFKFVNAEYVNRYVGESLEQAKKQSEKYKQEYRLLQKILINFIKSFKKGNTKKIDFSNIMTAPELKSLKKGVKQERGGYLFTDNGKLLLMMVLPSKNLNELNMIEQPLKIIRKMVKDTLKDFPGIDAGVTGRVVLQADEMNTSNNDMAKASIIALIIVTLLFILFFKNLPRPLLSTLSLIIAIVLTFGVTTITIGYLTILSIVFTVILIGLGIDFGVHILSRYKAELQGTGDIKKAIETTLMSTGKANVTSAVSISASFFAGMLTDFKGLEQLGFIGGVGIIITFLCMIIVLPAFLCLYDKRKKKHKNSKAFVLRFTFFKYALQYPKIVLISMLILTLSLIFFVKRVDLNLNLSSLQAEGLESVKYEHKLMENSNFSSWFGAFIVNDISTVKKYVEKVRKLPMVGEVHSILRVLPEKQNRKVLILRSLRRKLGNIKIQKKTDNIKVAEFKKNLKEMIKYFSLSLDLIKILGDKKLPDIHRTLKNLINMLKKLEILVNSTKPQKSKQILLNLQKSFFNSFTKQMSMFIKGLNPTKITEKNLDKTLPSDLKDRFISENGKYVIYAYSPHDLWEGEKMEQFVEQLRTVDKDVTGLAVLNAENKTVMKKGFKRAAIFAFIIVFIIIFIDFLNIIDTLFALIPMIFGLLWLVIAMGIFNIEFNFANFFAIPILIGIGIENGVQMIHRFKERGDFAVAQKSTGTGVILTALTTMAGFGSLLIAKHKGVFSLGLVMTIGVFTCLMAAMIMLPVMLKILYPKKRIKMTCPSCDGILNKKIKICPHCGLDLTFNKEESID